ncbi:hypothetical protein [Acaryochloris sp. IP29b_bin.148]|uniref:hypothetical protein n=1 Tax=Acaryochloris sp. IP29b_bin.148 TaxID=2969218 RepID=UPI00262F2E41|nr:hypothetical protein [Acaryochloris sp. IP29b_bin.148]
MAEQENASEPILGLVFLVFGILFAFLVYLRPDLLHVPAWIAYASAGVSAIAGLLVLTANDNRLDLQKLLILLLALLLCLISGWIAFGPGVRECSVHGAGGWTQQSGLACRIPFGLSMLIPIGLAWAVIHYDTPSNSQDT